MNTFEAVIVSCPSCGKQHWLDADMAGKKVDCSCGKKVDVPALKKPTAAAAEAHGPAVRLSRGQPSAPVAEVERQSKAGTEDLPKLAPAAPTPKLKKPIPEPDDSVYDFAEDTSSKSDVPAAVPESADVVSSDTLEELDPGPELLELRTEPAPAAPPAAPMGVPASPQLTANRPIGYVGAGVPAPVSEQKKGKKLLVPVGYAVLGAALVLGAQAFLSSKSDDSVGVTPAPGQVAEGPAAPAPVVVSPAAPPAAPAPTPVAPPAVQTPTATPEPEVVAPTPVETPIQPVAAPESAAPVAPKSGPASEAPPAVPPQPSASPTAAPAAAPKPTPQPQPTPPSTTGTPKPQQPSAPTVPPNQKPPTPPPSGPPVVGEITIMEGGDFGENQESAALSHPMKLTGPGKLQAVKLALAKVDISQPNAQGPVRVSVEADAGGAPSGKPIHPKAAATLQPAQVSPDSQEFVLKMGDIELSPGTYWVVIKTDPNWQGYYTAGPIKVVFK